ncbi:hypothetical protein OK006_4690 [Actinobacteria bacterium OK006]|nr:hypothetical protein OK006_4690 [Actinobacteria bacterium OK006]
MACPRPSPTTATRAVPGRGRRDRGTVRGHGARPRMSRSAGAAAAVARSPGIAGGHRVT